MFTGDLLKVGECINTFQKHKKFMAPGSEPLAISRMMSAVAPYVHGVSLAGAGGGGFIFFLTKEKDATSLVRNVLAGLPVS
jgi:fucokinase